VDFPIVDADTHVNEPPDLWEQRLPKKFKDQAPQVVDGPFGGKAWACPNGRTMGINILVNSAGISPTAWELLPKDGYDSMRPGGWDPAARIADMDIDMVDVHVLFPSYAFPVTDHTDRDLHVALIRAYNDWAAEFCSYAPERLFFQAMTPWTGIGITPAAKAGARR
jgi:uncharacterized protein